MKKFTKKAKNFCDNIDLKSTPEGLSKILIFVSLRGQQKKK